MAKKKFTIKNRVHGISHDEKKGFSTHEAGQVVELEEKDEATATLLKAGAIEPAEKAKAKEDDN